MHIRQHQAGDLGWLIAAHGEVYHREFKFDANFELNIAAKLVKILSADEPLNRLWIADSGQERAGCIAVSRLSDSTGFINFVLVIDKFRGQGLARQLMETMTAHCRLAQVKTLRLETYSTLVAARELYKKLGYEIVESETINEFGQSVQRECWALQLS